MSTKRTIPLDRVTPASHLQFRSSTDPDWVAHLERNWESVQSRNPIEVVVTPTTPPGDYWTFTQHRYQAARNRGLEQVVAVVHEVSDEEAVELAARSNLEHGKPMSKDDREKAVEAILRVNPNVSVEELAEKARSSTFVVKEIRDAQKLRRGQIAEGEGKISDTVYRVIGRTAGLTDAEKEKLAAAAQKGGWTKDETRFAVQQVKEADAWPDAYISRLERGEIKPIMVPREMAGTVVHLLSAVASPTQSREQNAVLALHDGYRALRAAEDRMDEFGLPPLDDIAFDQAIGELDAIIEAASRLRTAVDDARSIAGGR